jgi:hypothetical protein
MMSAEQSCLSARAELRFGGSSILHRGASSSSRKTRARGVRRHSSGRKLRRGRFRSINTPGLRACGYKTAPGRSNWPNRDPIAEKGGRNLYGFVDNRPLTRIDWLGLCTPGDKRKIKCNAHVSDWTSNPELDGAKGGLVDLAGDVQTFNRFISLVQIAVKAGKSVTEAIAQASAALFDEGVTVDARELARRLNELLKEGHGKWGGWSLWTRLTYEECQPCWFGLRTRWKRMPPTGWKEYNKDGIDGKGTFDDKLTAFRSVEAACAAHIEEFKSGGAK